MINTREVLEQLIRQNEQIEDNQPFTDESSLTQDLGYNSISFISLIMAIEEEFGIEFESDYMAPEKVDRFGDLINYIELRISQGLAER